MTESVSIDPDGCAREPIHTPGSIQPHGVMLVCEVEQTGVAFASANAPTELELHDTPLGMTLDEVLGHGATHTLRNALAKVGTPPAPGIVWNLELPSSSRRFDVLAHEHDRRLIVELEPVAHTLEDEDVALELAQSLVRRIATAESLDEIGTMAVRLLRATLGYDRVMLYKLLNNGTGRVIAEARRSDMQSFLGQRFPAVEVSEQTQHLYVRNWLRLVADAHSTPVPLLAAAGTRGTPVDMSYAHLRSESSIHCKHLRNAGVRASLAISIVIDGALWGVFACHHDGARTIPLRLRIAAEMFARHVSLQIERLERRGELLAANEAIARLDEVARDFGPNQTMEQALRLNLPKLKQLVDCDGAALSIHGQWTAIGSVPSRGEIGPVLRMLRREDIVTVWSTSDLRAHHGLAPPPTHVAGVLAIPLSGGARDYLLLFRNEEARSTARAWSDADRSVAETLMAYVRNLALRRIEMLDTERSCSEQRHRIHHDELQHRVKNILALVKSIAAQTGAHATSVEEYSLSLEGRLRALSYAHDQSFSQESRGDLAALLEAETNLLEFDSCVERVTLSGPDIGFTEPAFSSVALLMHEMTTNAAKYGALSSAGGRLAIQWNLTAEGDCVIDWTEGAGPPVDPPKRKGFGSTLIQRTVVYDLGGALDIRFLREGLTASFTIPARHVTQVRRAEPVAVRAPAPKRPLEGAGVLLVEDRALIALDTESVLRRLGAASIAAVPSAAAARAALAMGAPDVAILDFNLGDGTSEELAAMLVARGIPFVFLSGYANTTRIPADFAQIRVLRKPVDIVNAGEVLGALLAERRDD